MEDRKLYERGFLNEDEGLAAYLIEINVCKSSKEEVWQEIDAEVQLSDCSRQITLDFSVYHYNDNGKGFNVKLQERINKARKLADLFTKFANTLELELNSSKEREEQ